ncbi:MAG: undecaprenyl-phosphate glucose phosphotransferase [Polyangiaceae bacterium]|nr:undecaprenyl-phosphate glucose phosphotransferase [Polyangiaceae bacterium]
MSNPDTERTGGVLKTHASEMSALIRIVDAVVVFGTFWTSCTFYAGVEWSREETVASSLAVIAFLLVAEVNGLYRSWRGANLRQEALRILMSWGGVVGALLFVAFATKATAEYSRIATTAWVIVTPILLTLLRLILRRLLRELRLRGLNSRTVAIAGSTETGERLARTIVGDPTLGLRIRGVYDDRNRRRSIPEEVAPVAGTLDQLVEDARSSEIDIVYITLPLRAEHRITSLVTRLADTTATVYIVPEFYAYDLLHARWSTVGDQPVVSIFDTPFSGLGGWLKRLEDLVLGTMILMIVAMPMLLVAIAVKLDSKGPVFFRQRRYGLNGKPIYIWKFRSMTVCEDGADVPQAKQGDARVTRLGAFLRRTSIDELPQFFNVIAGDMSIVGPRPHAVAHNEIYRGKIKGYMLRHKVKPGITGWAQVNGWRGETDTMDKMERRVEHDLYYIHNWRLDWDLKIILLTVFGRAVRKNAY